MPPTGRCRSTAPGSAASGRPRSGRAPSAAPVRWWPAWGGPGWWCSSVPSHQQRGDGRGGHDPRVVLECEQHLRVLLVEGDARPGEGTHTSGAATPASTASRCGAQATTAQPVAISATAGPIGQPSRAPRGARRRGRPATAPRQRAPAAPAPGAAAGGRGRHGAEQVGRRVLQARDHGGGQPGGGDVEDAPGPAAPWRAAKAHTADQARRHAREGLPGHGASGGRQPGGGHRCSWRARSR